MGRAMAWCAAGIGLVLLFLESRSLSGAIGSDGRIFANAVRRVARDGGTLYDDVGGWADSITSLQGFIYPPPSILLLWPFGLGSDATNQWILGNAALVAAALALGLWWRHLTLAGVAPRGRLLGAAVLLPVFASGPVFSNRLGQIDTLILLLCIGAILLRHYGRAGWAAALVTAAAAVKIYPALLLLLWLAQGGDRRALFTGALLSSVITIGATLLLVPPDMFSLYLFDMLPEMSRRTIADIYNQSLHAVIARQGLVPADVQNAFPAMIVAPWQRASAGLAALALPLLLAWRAHGHGTQKQLWVSAATLAVIPLAAPLGWGHSYAFALPLLLLCAGSGLAEQRPLRVLLAAACWALLLIPAHRQFAMLDAGPHTLWWLAHARYAIAATLLLALAWLATAPAEPKVRPA